MTTTAGLSRRARTEQTRTRILDAARILFVERGYRATSLRDVAVAAGLSHPGLLKHFASKGELLMDVVAAIESHNETGSIGPNDDAHGLPFTTLAARNEGIPGYLEMFAALSGEACAHTHPARAPMAARYARLRALSTNSLAEYARAGEVSAQRDPAMESVKVAATWDGLQLLRLYLPERVDVTGALRLLEQHLRRPPGWRPEGSATPEEVEGPPAAASHHEGPTPAIDPRRPARASTIEDRDGYRVGRERRGRILADATSLFARQGYADTSLREIAAAVGVSKSALLHHYPSKEHLLRAVLVERDAKISVAAFHDVGTDARAWFRGLPGGATANARDEPGLIEVYAVLSCEAIPDEHPAHEYFRTRFDGAIDDFATMFALARAQGSLPAHRDPLAEAIALVALWDGLQYQWLYDPVAVDVAAHLAAHLADVIP